MSGMLLLPLLLMAQSHDRPARAEPKACPEQSQQHAASPDAARIYAPRTSFMY